MVRKLEQIINNSYEELGRLAGKVSAFTEECNLPHHAAYAIDLAVEELITNIIKYAYPEQNIHKIQLSITCNEKQIDIEVIDSGVEFDPRSVSEPDQSLPIEDRPIGGLGLMMVRNTFNSFIYHRKNGNNISHLIFVLDN